MSWQGTFHLSHTSHMIFQFKRLIAYVDTNLVGSGKVSRAAILGQQGGVWAASSGYSVRAIYRSACLYADIFQFCSFRRKSKTRS